MSTDLHQETGEELGPKKGSAQILRHEIQEGRTAIERPVSGLFISGLSAGLDIGFSLLLMAIMWTLVAGQLPGPVTEMLVANMYAVGFIFVVLGRKASPAALARTWAVVYVANLIGAAAFAAFAVLIGPALGIIDRRVFGQIATSLTAHPAEVIFLSAVLAGWLMGLLSWLVAASRDTISQLVIVWLIATVIGFAHLHHVVVGSVEVLAGVFAGEQVAAADYGHFLLWTTLGNALGGPLFVALVKYGHARPEAQPVSGGGP